MRAHPHTNPNPLARRFAQVCAVAFATLLTSGLGLLMFMRASDEPAWLRIVVWLAAATVVLSFVGWLIVSVAALASDEPYPR
jgi:hypothetical protein